MHALSETSAMPVASFSLPARRTCPGALFGPDATCSTCYADGRGRYRWRSVKRAQERRLTWTLDALETDRFVPSLIGCIACRGEGYFRIHDAGDFFSVAYTAAWGRIARALPLVRFWAPTRSWALHGRFRPDGDPLLAALRELNGLLNVTVRPSAIFLEEPPPVIPGLSAGSTVTRDRASVTCPKSLHRPARCGTCRRCWDEPLVPVTYLRH